MDLGMTGKWEGYHLAGQYQKNAAAGTCQPEAFSNINRIQKAAADGTSFLERLQSMSETAQETACGNQMPPDIWFLHGVPGSAAVQVKKSWRAIQLL